MLKGCVPSTIKYVLIAVNFLVMLTGLIVLGFSIYGLVDNKGFDNLVQEGATALGEDVTFNLYSSAFIILIIFSSVIVFISFLGCCGAYKENRFALFLYFALLLVVFVGIAAGATLTTAETLSVLRKPLLKSMSKYNPDSTDQAIKDVNAAWDGLQRDFSCCGVDSFLDWSNKNVTDVYPDDESHLVPESCCSGYSGIDLEACRKNPENSAYLSKMNGCFSNLELSIENNKGNIQIAAGAIVAFLFINLLVLFGFALCLNPNNGYEQV